MCRYINIKYADNEIDNSILIYHRFIEAVGRNSSPFDFSAVYSKRK